MTPPILMTKMEVAKFSISACCGKTAVAFKVKPAISNDLLKFLLNNNFIENKQFTSAGILFVENKALIVSGTFGSDVLNIKCKISNCNQFVDDFEKLLIQVE